MYAFVFIIYNFRLQVKHKSGVRRGTRKSLKGAPGIKVYLSTIVFILISYYYFFEIILILVIFIFHSYIKILISFYLKSNLEIFYLFKVMHKIVRANFQKMVLIHKFCMRNSLLARYSLLTHYIHNH